MQRLPVIKSQPLWSTKRIRSLWGSRQTTYKNLKNIPDQQLVFIDDLPDEVLLRILSYLPTSDLVLNMSLVSKRFNRLSKDREAHTSVTFAKDLNLLRYRETIYDFLKEKTSVEHVKVGTLHWKPASQDPEHNSLVTEISMEGIHQFFTHLVFKQEKIKSLSIDAKDIVPFLVHPSIIHPSDVSLDHLEITGYQHDTFWLRPVLQFKLKKLTIHNLDSYNQEIFLSLVSSFNMDILNELNVYGWYEHLTLKNQRLSFTVIHGCLEGNYLLSFINRATKHTTLQRVTIAVGDDKTKTRIDIEKGFKLNIRVDQEHVPLEELTRIMAILKDRDWIPPNCTIKLRHKTPLSANFIADMKAMLPESSILVTKRYYFDPWLF